MSIQTIVFSHTTGLDLRARLYLLGSSEAFAPEVACVEADRGGVYSFMQSSSSGQYEVHVRNVTGGADEPLGIVFVKTMDVAGTFQCVSEPALLEIAEGGGGGAAPTYIMPLRATAGQRVVPGRVTLFLKERVLTVLPIVDERGQPVDCGGKTCSLLVDVNGVVVAVPDLVPAGTPPHRYSFTPTEAMTAMAGEFEFALRTPSGSGYEVLAWGVVQVLKAVAE